MACSQALSPVREDEILMDTIRIPLSWHESISGVSQTFDNVKSLRMALTNYDVAHHFVYKFVKNDLQRLTVECDKKESMNCKWRLHAFPIKQGPIWSIKKYNELHACGGSIASVGHPHVACKCVASILQSIIKKKPTYHHVDARKDIREQCEIKMPYNTIWHGKELAREQFYGEGNRSYNMLRWYEGKVKETNPYSLVTIHKRDDEDTSNWSWFLSHFSRVLYQGPRTYEPSYELVIVFDSDKGLKEDVRTCFPKALHSFCVLHLAQNYRDNLKKKGFPTNETQAFGQMMKTTAYRCSFRDFEKYMAVLKGTSKIAYNILMTSYP